MWPSGGAKVPRRLSKITRYPKDMLYFSPVAKRNSSMDDKAVIVIHPIPLIWTLENVFPNKSVAFMDFLLIWTILAGTNVVHISGIGCTPFICDVLFCF